MGVLLSIATVLFVILCILLVILIMLQSDKSAGLGLLGGSSQSAFGSSTADVITKITGGMIAFFMLLAMGLSYLESVGTISIEQKIRDDKEDIDQGIDIEGQVETKADKDAADISGEDKEKETNVLNKKLK